MKVLVCGSRSLNQANPIVNRLDRLPSDAEIIHGGAVGPDRHASFWARSRGRTQVIFRADWEKHGKRAGFIRNLEMLDTKPDLVIAFWDGHSRGTKHTIDEARRRGIETEIVGV